MYAVSTPSRQKSWQDPRQRVSVLAELAIHKKTVVDKLASLREDHDLTQEKAAQAVGVTVRQWQRWESGASVPYPRNLDAIAGHFGFEVSEFFTDDGPRAAPDESGPTQLDRIETLLEQNQQIILALAQHAGLIPETTHPERSWAAFARLREELAARAEQASPPARRQRKSSTG